MSCRMRGAARIRRRWIGDDCVCRYSRFLQCAPIVWGIFTNAVSFHVHLCAQIVSRASQIEGSVVGRYASTHGDMLAQSVLGRLPLATRKVPNLSLERHLCSSGLAKKSQSEKSESSQSAVYSPMVLLIPSLPLTLCFSTAMSLWTLLDEMSIGALVADWLGKSASGPILCSEVRYLDLGEFQKVPGSKSRSRWYPTNTYVN